MGCPRQSVGPQRNAHGVPTIAMFMEGPWDVHGVPTGCTVECPWDARGIPMGYARRMPMGCQRDAHDGPWDARRVSHRMPTGCPFGCLRDVPWDTHGIYMGCPRDAQGMPTDAHGMPRGCPRDAHGIPTGCPRDAQEMAMGCPRDACGEVSRGASGKNLIMYITSRALGWARDTHGIAMRDAHGMPVMKCPAWDIGIKVSLVVYTTTRYFRESATARSVTADQYEQGACCPRVRTLFVVVRAPILSSLTSSGRGRNGKLLSSIFCLSSLEGVNGLTQQCLFLCVTVNTIL